MVPVRIVSSHRWQGTLRRQCRKALAERSSPLHSHSLPRLPKAGQQVDLNFPPPQYYRTGAGVTCAASRLSSVIRRQYRFQYRYGRATCRRQGQALDRLTRGARKPLCPGQPPPVQQRVLEAAGQAPGRLPVWMQLGPCTTRMLPLDLDQLQFQPGPCKPKLMEALRALKPETATCCKVRACLARALHVSLQRLRWP